MGNERTTTMKHNENGTNGQNKANRGLSRRTFLTGAAVTGLAAAGALAGCSPKSAVAEADAADGSAKPEHRWQSQAAADWRTPPEPVDEAKIADGGTFDVVVVGGGQAGTWTARSATMNGASVCVVEAQPEDSFFYIGGEVAIINSEWAIEHGADRIDKVNFMTNWLVRNANRSNQRLIRNFVDYSGQIMDWSISEIDEVDPDFYHNTDRVNIYSAEADDRMVMDPSGYQFYKSTIVHRPVTGGGSDWEWGPVVMTHHREQAIKEGAAWHFNTYAEYLEKDDSGRVVAVVARNQDDDSYVRYTGTRGVVLTAGDFQANEDMIRDINDEYRHLAENYGNIELATSGGMGVKDGAGIKLGVWAGGHVEAGPRTGMNTGQSGPWETAPWGPGFMLLNQRGLRFCNECAGGTEGSGYQSSRQPKGAIVSVADAGYLDTIACMPPAHGAINLTSKVTFHGIDPLQEQMAALDPSSTEPSKDGVYCANTFEELLDKIGCYNEEQKANALSELEKWNQYAEAGLDEDFAVDARIMKPLTTPPFYAVTGNAEDIYVGLCQTTGLDTDFNGCVLDSDLFPIPGLYSAGNNSGNRYIVNYCTPISGMSLGLCMTEGMLLGKRLATTAPEDIEQRKA